VDKALAAVLDALPVSSLVLVRRPAPLPALRLRTGEGSVEEVEEGQLGGMAASMDWVVDAGELARCGLVFDLGAFRWDVLGRIEEALRAVFALLALVRPGGGRLLMLLAGDPMEYLTAYFSAFSGVRVELQPAVTAVGPPSPRRLECVVEARVDEEAFEAVMEREVNAERSHRRYADVLDAALAGVSYVVGGGSGSGSAGGLRVLDVGGGDGHMAEWWAASGHDIHLLEVDTASAQKARTRLGEDHVTLHDGKSAWPFADRSFDVCLLLFVLHHILPEEALRKTLTEVARVTRKKVLVLEDVPHAAPTPGLRRLAAAVTAEHFRPFGQDPSVYMCNIRPDQAWRPIFEAAGLEVESARAMLGTLQHPVPHLLYTLRPVA